MGYNRGGYNSGGYNSYRSGGGYGNPERRQQRDFDDSKIWFGKNKGLAWSEVEEDWLQWCIDNHENVKVKDLAAAELDRRMKGTPSSTRNALDEPPRTPTHSPAPRTQTQQAAPNSDALRALMEELVNIRERVDKMEAVVFSGVIDSELGV